MSVRISEKTGSGAHYWRECWQRLAEETPSQCRRRVVGQALLLPRNWDMFCGIWNREGCSPMIRSCGSCQEKLLLTPTGGDFESVWLEEDCTPQDHQWWTAVHARKVHLTSISPVGAVGLRPKVLEESILIRVPQCGAAHPGLRCAETLLLQPLGQLSRTWGSGAPGKVASGQEHPPQSATVWPANSRHSCVLCAALRSDRPRSPPLEDVLEGPPPHLSPLYPLARELPTKESCSLASLWSHCVLPFSAFSC